MANTWTPEDTLYSLQIHLGMPKVDHHLESIDPLMVNKGKEIYFQGQTTDLNGNKTDIQSKIFKCSHCHNTVREDANLNSLDNPVQRMTYLQKKNIKLMTGTTIFGLVNKTSWFNGDYIKKYGEPLIGPARNNLHNALQLCSKECSKGRLLDNFELEAMMNYLWSLQYKLADLNLNEQEWKLINDESIGKPDKLALLNSKYAKKSNATFGNIPADFEQGYGNVGNPKDGQFIFEQSCLHCHNTQTTIPEIPKFRDRKITYRFLYRMTKLYKPAREGKFSEDTYMPNYTQEKLSDKHLDDLKAYLKLKIDETSTDQ
jgi:cytochrome c553